VEREDEQEMLIGGARDLGRSEKQAELSSLHSSNLIRLASVFRTRCSPIMWAARSHLAHPSWFPSFVLSLATCGDSKRSGCVLRVEAAFRVLSRDHARSYLDRFKIKLIASPLRWSLNLEIEIELEPLIVYTWLLTSYMYRRLIRLRATFARLSLAS